MCIGLSLKNGHLVIVDIRTVFVVTHLGTDIGMSTKENTSLTGSQTETVVKKRTQAVRIEELEQTSSQANREIQGLKKRVEDLELVNRDLLAD